MNLKTNKGITLIALVITIIVLLILAGVTISMVLGDDGIIKNAQTAKENTAKMEEEERVRLAVANAVVDGLGTVNLTDSEADGSLYKALKNEFGENSDIVTSYNGDGNVKVGDRTFTVDTKGTVSEVVEEEPDDEGDGSLAGDIELTITGDDVIGVGKTKQLQASAEGVTWTSSNPDVLEVSNTGEISVPENATVADEGTDVTITATLGNATGTKTIKVKELITFSFESGCVNYPMTEFTAYKGDTVSDWYNNPEFDHGEIQSRFDSNLNDTIYYYSTSTFQHADHSSADPLLGSHTLVDGWGYYCTC